MKINWGTKLAFVALLFMTFVITMVVIISQQEVYLVDPNYYEKGLNFQKEIDNNASVDSSISMEIVKVEMGSRPSEISLLIYKSAPGDIKAAQLHYYRPSNPALDQKFNTEILSGKRMRHSLQNLDMGKWKVLLSWKEGANEFKLEKEFER